MQLKNNILVFFRFNLEMMTKRCLQSKIALFKDNLEKMLNFSAQQNIQKQNNWYIMHENMYIQTFFF